MASTDLVAAEQFFIGGVGTVRGYALAQFAGDNGYAVTGEVRLAAPGFSDVPAFLGKTWGEILQLYAFVDHGGPGSSSRSRASAGAIPNRVGAGLSVSVARTSCSTSSTRGRWGRDPSDGRDNVVYFRPSSTSASSRVRSRTAHAPTSTRPAVARGPPRRSLRRGARVGLPQGAW